MAAVRRPSTAARGQPKPRTGANRPDPHHLDDGNGHATGSTNGWSAHLRYFLARYPPEARDFVAQRLTAYGIRSLLSSNRVEDLILHALVSATDAADRDVLSLMRQHARGRREQRDGRQVTAASARRSGVPSPRRQHQPHGNGGSSPAPREALRDCGIARNTNAAARVAPALPAAAGSGKRHEVVGRPDVLTRYPFVDHLGATQGGGVGAALHRATPTTPIQYLAKREIRRLAHDAFRELKASALGIRLSDLPCALQFLFFGDSASLLTAKGGGTGGGGGGSGGGGGGVRAVGRNAKVVHLVMALARECLPPTLALAARDTSTLSSASTHGGAEAGWVRDGQTQFISERRWIKIVAYVIRRLWEMDGTPSSFSAARARRQRGTAAGPFRMDFQQPVWRPAGGGGGGRRVAAAGGPHGGAERFLGADEDGGGDHEEAENTESFLEGITADSRSDSAGGWGASAISAEDVDGDYYYGGGDGGGGGGGALRAWEEEGEGWVGAGRSLAWAPGEDDEEVGAGEEDGLQGEGRPLFRAPRGPGPGGVAAAARGRRRRLHRGDGGGGHAGEKWKEGTRPAGMWEVTPPAHVAALRRGRRQGGGGGGGGREGGRRGGGPAYLRDVQSRIGPHLNAHRERLRKIASARRAAVKDVVARRRLDQLAGGGGGGGGIGMHGGGGRRDSSAADWGSQARGHTPGEHALDIAGAFLESSLMTRLAGGDWFDSEDGEPTSAEFSSAWETEEAVRVPPLGGRRHNRASSGPSMGRHGLDHNGGGGVGGRRESSRREEGGHGDATRRRQAYTGWLGDFGPVHTHTVREVADAGDGDDEEDRSEGDIDGAGADAGSGGRNRRDPAGREEGEGKGGTRRSWQLEEGGAPGRGGVGGGDDAAERSDGTAEEAGVDESTAAVASVAASGRGADATLSGAADSSSEAQALGGGGDSTGGPEAGADDGRNNNINEDDDGGNVGTAETGAANIVAPLDGGLDAYLQLASDSGALHGGGGAALGGGGGGDGGSGGGLGPGVGVGGGSPGAYTGATSGSWWEEDRSEVGTSPP